MCGGLRHSEIMELQLEKFRVTADGVIVTHQHSKQRSDKRESKESRLQWLIHLNKKSASFITSIRVKIAACACVNKH